MNSFLETLKQLGAARLGIMGGIFVGMLMFFVFVSVRVSTPEMKLLYSDLSSEDAGAIAAKLEESQIKYDISSDGSRVIVPEDQIGRARMLLAEAGLPNGGSLGYELFDDQSGFGTTNFVQNINQVRALEGELARTISSLEHIRSARVHIVFPQRELFSRENKKASASVFLGLRPGGQIEREQILAIQSLVASAVPNLNNSDIAVIDSNGNLLAKTEDSGTDLMSIKAEEMRLNYERRLAEKVEDQVGRVVGFGKVRATITADMNFDRISTNEELYDPEGQVLRSSQVTEENELERDNSSSDQVGVETNLPGIDSAFADGSSPSLENKRTEEVTNFEISKTVRNVVREAGEIKRLSVAVLVDGKTVTNEEGAKVYEARSEQELEQIKALVRSAVGFNEERGDSVEVVNMPFAVVDTNEEFFDDSMLLGFEKNKLVEFAQIVTVAIMMILVVMLILKPMVNRLLENEAPELDNELDADLLAARPMNPALAAPDGSSAMFSEDDGVEESLIDIQGVEGKVKASSIKKVEEIVANYPNETVSVIRSWMTQESS